VDKPRLIEMTQPQVLDIVKALPISPILKGIVSGMLRRATPKQMKEILVQVEAAIKTLRSEDAVESQRLRDELNQQAMRVGLPPIYLKSLLDAVSKRDAANHPQQ